MALEALSCASEKISSCAKDISSSNRECFLAQTIQDFAPSMLWLQGGVDLGKDFDDLIAIVKVPGVFVG